MTKLTEKEREGFEKVLAADLIAINVRFMNQIKDFWGIARLKILEKRGWDRLIIEKTSLQKQQEEIKNRIHEIEEELNSGILRAEQIVELGGKPDEYGRHSGANFYGIPVTSQFEYEIVEFIRGNLDLEIPSKIIRDICHASIRALVMAGTFEEAREVYEKFYSMDFRKFGVDIPPRLDEVCSDKKLLTDVHQTLRQIDKRSDSQLIAVSEDVITPELMR